MSEQNILNPTSASLFNPRYGWQRERRRALQVFEAGSGKVYKRRVGARPLMYRLTWELPKTEALQLVQFAEQYLFDFFSLADHERGRYYSVHFVDGPTEVWEGNDRVTYTAIVEELPGLALFAYPTNWARDAVFIEERNGLGETLAKLTGTWNTETDANDHGGKAYNSNVTNDTAEWVYFGYGFRFWSKKQGNLGEVEVSATRTRDGGVVLAATTVDLYNAAAQASAALLTKDDLPLDEYRVKLRVKGTKNAASSGFFVLADAIEVML